MFKRRKLQVVIALMVSVLCASLLAAFTVAVSPAHAITLARWDVHTAGPIDSSTPFAATFVASGVSPSGISLAPLLVPDVIVDQFSAHGWRSASEWYFEISIGPSGLSIVDLETLTFTMERDAQGPQHGFLRTSFDGFSSTIFDWNMVGGDALQTVDLTGFAPLALDLTFRFYGDHESGFEGRAAFLHVPVTFSGSVVAPAQVPEPKTVILPVIGIAGMVAVALKRRERIGRG